MKKYIPLLFLPPLVAACNPVMYAPTAYQAPLFEQKGEISITAAYHDLDSGDGHGLNLQFATAVDSSRAITFTLNQFSDTNDNTNPDSWRSGGVYLEAGVGKFGFVNPGSRIKYELYGGLGMGRANNRTLRDNISASFLKPYIQPNLGISGKYLELALSTRLGVVSFFNTSNVTSEMELRRSVDDFFKAKKTTMVFEPGFTLRGGGKYFKAQLQYSYSSFNHQDRHGSIFGYADDYLSLGFTYLISRRHD